MQMQQQCLKTSDVQFKRNDAFTVWIITEQFQQLAIKMSIKSLNAELHLILNARRRTSPRL